MANDTSSSKQVIDHVNVEKYIVAIPPHTRVVYEFYTADGKLVNDMDAIKQYIALNDFKDNPYTTDNFLINSKTEMLINLQDDSLYDRMFNDGRKITHVLGEKDFNDIKKIAEENSNGNAVGGESTITGGDGTQGGGVSEIPNPALGTGGSLGTAIAATASDDYAFFSIDKMHSFSPSAYSEEQLTKLLYTKFINPTNAVTFSNFLDSAKTKIDIVVNYKDLIKNTLMATNSEAFYSGTTASSNIKILDDIAEHIENLKKDINDGLTAEEVRSIIEQYNDDLSRNKEETRKYLTKNIAEDINQAEQIKTDNGVTLYESTTPMPPVEYQVLKPYIRKTIKYELVSQKKNIFTGVTTYTYNKDDKDYFYIEEINDEFRSMEKDKILPAEAEGCTVHKLPYVPDEVEDSVVGYQN